MANIEVEIYHRLSLGAVFHIQQLNMHEMRITTGSSESHYQIFSEGLNSDSSKTEKLLRNRFSGIDYASTYHIWDIYGTNRTEISSWTTPPARPVISNISSAGNSVTVQWALEETSKWTHYYIKLFKIESGQEIDSGIYVDLAETVGTKWQSGVHTFTNVSDGIYIIKAQTYYNPDGGYGHDIPCCTDDVPPGTVTNIPAPDDLRVTYTEYKYVSSQFRVGNFSWTYSYINSNGVPQIGTVKQMDRTSGKYLYITADEWNELCDFLYSKNQMSARIGESKYGYPATATYRQLLTDANVVQNEEISARKFNLLKYCIGSFEPTGITDVGKDDSMVISYFNTLAEKANLI